MCLRKPDLARGRALGFLDECVEYENILPGRGLVEHPVDAILPAHAALKLQQPTVGIGRDWGIPSCSPI
jgi:hypothetical protein